MVSSFTLGDLAKYGVQVQIQGNKIVLIFPKSAIEQRILEEMLPRAPQELKNKISVKALGDVIVEVNLI